MSETDKSEPTVYVAADFLRKEEVAALCAQLEKLGLEPTNTCTLDGEPGGGAGGELEGEAEQNAIATARLDLDDIDRSELFIQLTTGELARGGRHVKLGYALSRELTIIIVGPREHVFHYHPQVHHLPTADMLLIWLRGWLSA